VDSNPVLAAATAASIDVTPEPPQQHKWLVATAVLLGAILTILDGSIVNSPAVRAAKLWRWRRPDQLARYQLLGGSQRNDSDERMDRGADRTPALPADLGRTVRDQW